MTKRQGKIHRCFHSFSSKSRKYKHCDGVSDIHKRAYQAFNLLIEGRHGSPTRTYGIIAKSLLPNVLMTFVSAKGATISKPIKAIRESAVSWVISTVRNAAENKNLISCLLSLMQHICLGIPDRAEHRTLACQTIVEMIELLPSPQQREFVDFLRKLSRNQKMAVRQYAVDLATSLLDLRYEVEGGRCPSFLPSNFLRTRKSSCATLDDPDRKIFRQVPWRAGQGFIECGPNSGEPTKQRRTSCRYRRGLLSQNP